MARSDKFLFRHHRLFGKVISIEIVVSEHSTDFTANIEEDLTAPVWRCRMTWLRWCSVMHAPEPVYGGLSAVE